MNIFKLVLPKLEGDTSTFIGGAFNELGLWGRLARLDQVSYTGTWKLNFSLGQIVQSTDFMIWLSALGGTWFALILFFSLVLNVLLVIFLQRCKAFNERTIYRILEKSQEITKQEEKLKLHIHKVKQTERKLKEARQFILEQNSVIQRKDHALLQKEKRLALADLEVHSSYEALMQQQEEIEHKTKNMLESLSYARHIQESLLPELSHIQKVLPESFILFRPRDIVSGDFYWFHALNHRTIISAIDCTGHGVPGAFLSLIGYELLNKIVISKDISEPDKVLNQLHLELRQSLRQKENKNEDGMELAFCAIHRVPQGMQDLFGKPRLEFAGARSSLIYIQHGKLHQIKGDKVPIGGHLYQENHKFTKHTIDISVPTTFYIFSDGYMDQFGGNNRRKFMMSRFRALLQDIHEEPMDQQRIILENQLKQWMGNYMQLDDILVMGVKLDAQV